MKILVVIGSIREGRVGDKVGNWVIEQSKKRTDVQYELFDLKDHPMKLYEEPGYPAMMNANTSDEVANKWIKKVAESDGFVFITPEYNHGTSSALKNAIDYPYNEWVKKPVAFVGYGGMSGGARAVEQLRTNFIELQTVVIREGVLIQFISSKIKEGVLSVDEHVESGMEKTFAQLEWYAKVLKTARES